MDPTRDDVLMILEIMRESDVRYLDPRMGDLKVVLGEDAPVDLAGAPTAGGGHDGAAAPDARTAGQTGGARHDG